MIIRMKWIALAEAIIIVALLGVFFYVRLPVHQQQPNIKQGLLSPRIYAGILEPKSYMIVNFNPLEESFQKYIQAHNLNIALYVQNLRNGEHFGINENEGTFPASLNKLPVAILIMQKVEKGALSLDTQIPFTISNITPYTPDIYKKNKQLPLRVLLEKMLKESDNDALNILSRYIDAEEIQMLLDYIALDPVGSYHYDKELWKKSNRLLSPEALSNLFSTLYFSTVLEANSSEYLLTILANTTFDLKRVALLPENVTLAHKFGLYDENGYKLFNDCGILYIDRSRILYCIFIRDLNPEDAGHIVGAFVNAVYEYVTNTRTVLNTYKKTGFVSA